jgi:tetratricopeptide (TPR) repeat protein
MDAEAEFALGNYALAVSKLEEAVALAPDSGQLHLALSLAYGALGSYDLSADAIRRGIELSGEGDPLVPDLRTLYGSDELLAQQLARIADAVRANPGDLDLRLVEAYFLLGGDRSQAAQAALDTLQARAPQDLIVQRLLDTALERVRLGLRGDEDTGYAGDDSGGGLAPQPGEVAPRTQPTTGARPPAPPASTPDSGSGGSYPPPPSRDYSPPPPRWF